MAAEDGGRGARRAESLKPTISVMGNGVSMQPHEAGWRGASPKRHLSYAWVLPARHGLLLQSNLTDDFSFMDTSPAIHTDFHFPFLVPQQPSVQPVIPYAEALQHYGRRG